jgi:hypothetical protein
MRVLEHHRTHVHTRTVHTFCHNAQASRSGKTTLTLQNDGNTNQTQRVTICSARIKHSMLQYALHESNTACYNMLYTNQTQHVTICSTRILCCRHVQVFCLLSLLVGADTFIPPGFKTTDCTGTEMSATRFTLA